MQNGQRRLQGQHRLLTGSERHPELGQGLAGQQLLRQPDQGLLLLPGKALQNGHRSQGLLPLQHARPIVILPGRTTKHTS